MLSTEPRQLAALQHLGATPNEVFLPSWALSFHTNSWPMVTLIPLQTPLEFYKVRTMALHDKKDLIFTHISLVITIQFSCKSLSKQRTIFLFNHLISLIPFQMSPYSRRWLIPTIDMKSKVDFWCFQLNQTNIHILLLKIIRLPNASADWSERLPNPMLERPSKVFLNSLSEISMSMSKSELPLN